MFRTTATAPFHDARRLGIGASAVLALLAAQPVTAAPVPAKGVERRARKAVPKPRAEPLAIEQAALADAPMPSEATNRLVAWVAAAKDNRGMPYIVIDKQNALLLLFGGDGQALGQAPVLLGVGIGDDSSPGVGAKSLAEIGPAERTTPAGRFIAKFGRAFGNQRVLWVDYANSVALHAVITTNKKERRVARLLSPTPDDNRVTFGCINVGTSFYTKTLRPLFQKKGGIVYVLPDSRPVDEVFPRLRLLPYIPPAGPLAKAPVEADRRAGSEGRS